MSVRQSESHMLAVTPRTSHFCSHRPPMCFQSYMVIRMRVRPSTDSWLSAGRRQRYSFQIVRALGLKDSCGRPCITRTGSKNNRKFGQYHKLNVSFDTPLPSSSPCEQRVRPFPAYILKKHLDITQSLQRPNSGSACSASQLQAESRTCLSV